MEKNRDTGRFWNFHEAQDEGAVSVDYLFCPVVSEFTAMV